MFACFLQNVIFYVVSQFTFTHPFVGEQMSGWFDVYDWPIGLDAKDDPKGLAMSVKRVDQIVTQLKDEEGIDKP